MTTVTPPPPLYWRFLRLRHVRPNGWQRAALVEGVLATSVVLTLADVASAWTLVVLPLASVAVVKAHDLLAGSLTNRTQPQPLPPPALGDYAPIVVIVGVLLVLRLVVHGNAAFALVVLGYAIDVAVAAMVYRYLRRRGTQQSTAVGIAVVSFLLSPLAGVLGAALEVRREQRGSVSG